MRLSKTFINSSILKNLNFNLNHVLDKFSEERYGDDDLNEAFKNFHGLLDDTINQFIPTKACKKNKQQTKLGG